MLKRHTWHQRQRDEQYSTILTMRATKTRHNKIIKKHLKTKNGYLEYRENGNGKVNHSFYANNSYLSESKQKTYNFRDTYFALILDLQPTKENTCKALTMELLFSGRSPYQRYKNKSNRAELTDGLRAKFSRFNGILYCWWTNHIQKKKIIVLLKWPTII